MHSWKSTFCEMRKYMFLLSAVLLVSCGTVFNTDIVPGEESGDNGHYSDRMCPHHDSGEQVINHYAYSLAYSEEHEQPLWTAYMVTAERVEGQVERTDYFLEDEAVKTGSALYYDYKHSGYSRGHLVPAGDMKWNQLAMEQSFFMSNMSPQLQSFNSGVWNRMEEQVRRWAKRYDTLYVVTGPVLSDYGIDQIDAVGIDGGAVRFESIGVDTEITVPFYFFKAVYDPDRERAIAFLVPHEGSSAHIKTFVVSIDELESALGFDLFPQLPDDLENVVERESSQQCINSWNWEK